MTRRSIGFGFLLHLLVPGLGYIYWREYIFGIFVFLVAVLASVLAIVSILISLPLAAAITFYALPALFYLFTFFDLVRTIKNKQSGVTLTRQRAVIAVLIGVALQFLAPVAPINFALRNHPDVFVQPDNRLSPLFNEGDLLCANGLAYKLEIIAARKPILHSVPDRFEVVRFESESGDRLCGIVIGMPGEEVEVVDGIVVVDGYAIVGEPAGGIVLSGDWPLTPVGGYSMLIATLSLGRVDEAHEVPLPALVGKVHRLL